MSDEGRERRKRRRKGGGLRVPSDNVPRRTSPTTAPPPTGGEGGISAPASDDAPSGSGRSVSAQQAAVAYSMGDRPSEIAPVIIRPKRQTTDPGLGPRSAGGTSGATARPRDPEPSKAGDSNGAEPREAPSPSISAGWSDSDEATRVDPDPGAERRSSEAEAEAEPAVSGDTGRDGGPAFARDTRPTVGRGGPAAGPGDRVDNGDGDGDGDDARDGLAADAADGLGGDIADDLDDDIDEEPTRLDVNVGPGAPGDDLDTRATQQLDAYVEPGDEPGVPSPRAGSEASEPVPAAAGATASARPADDPAPLSPRLRSEDGASEPGEGAPRAARRAPSSAPTASGRSRAAATRVTDLPLPKAAKAGADAGPDAATSGDGDGELAPDAASSGDADGQSKPKAAPAGAEPKPGAVVARADAAESGELLSDELLEEVEAAGIVAEFDDEPETQPSERRPPQVRAKPARAETVVEAVEELSAEEIVEVGGRATGAAPPKPPPAPPAKPKAPPAAPQSRKRKGKPWFEEIFDEDYLRTLPFLTPQATQAESLFVLESLGIEPGAQVLDVGCGYGRHAMELAARGMHVVGLDLSLPLLIRGADEAQRRGLNINFVHGDMRELAFDAQFDGAYCLFGTFGFFDDETNKKAAQNIARALKPGGRMVIDVLNRDYLVADLPSRVWWEGDGCVVLEEVEFNYFSSRIVSNRSVVFDDGRQLEQEISMRAYSLHELGKLLHAAGFRILEVSGSIETRGRFFGNHSRSILVVCERRAPKEDA